MTESEVVKIGELETVEARAVEVEVVDIGRETSTSIAREVEAGAVDMMGAIETSGLMELPSSSPAC